MSNRAETQQELESTVAYAIRHGLHEDEANAMSLRSLQDFIYLRRQGFEVREIIHSGQNPFLRQKMKEALLHRDLQEDVT